MFWELASGEVYYDEKYLGVFSPPPLCTLAVSELLPPIHDIHTIFILNTTTILTHAHTLSDSFFSWQSYSYEVQ